MYAHSPRVKTHFFIEDWITSVLNPVFNCKNAADLFLRSSNDHTVTAKRNITKLEKH